MTVALFLTLFTILSAVNSLITEAIKKAMQSPKPTLIAAVLATVTGWGGGVAAYILMGVAFTPASIVSLVLLAPAIWVGSTVGYDKVKEIIVQIGVTSKKSE